MYNCIIANFPFVKESVAVFVERFFGIKLDLHDIKLGNERGVEVCLKNIEADPAMLNEFVLKGVNIKITTFNIGEFRVNFSISGLKVMIKGLDLMIMPVKDNYICENKEKKDNNNEKNKKNSNNTKNSTNAGVTNFLMRNFETVIENINIRMLNYETQKCNMFFANPMLSILINRIGYEKIENFNEKESTMYDNTCNNFYDKKCINIDGFSVQINKSFDIDKSPELNHSNNSTIFHMNPKKGIFIYTNTNNNFSVRIGEIQSVIGAQQLQYVINFLENYLFQISSPQKTKNITKKNETSESFTFSLTCNFDLISFIITESENETILRQFCFDKDEREIQAHFANYALSYFALFIRPWKFSMNPSSQTISSLSLSMYFVEREAHDEGSLFEIASEELEPFKSMTENDLQQTSNQIEFLSYEIMQIKNISLIFSQNSLSLSIEDIHIDFHLVYMFKIIKLAYKNIDLLKELLCCQEYKLRQSCSVTTNGTEKEFANIKDNRNHNGNTKTDSGDFKMKVLINSFTFKIHSFIKEKKFPRYFSHYFPSFYYDCIFFARESSYTPLGYISTHNAIVIKSKDISLNMHNSDIDLKIPLFDLSFQDLSLLKLERTLNVKMTKENKMNVELGLTIEIHPSILQSMIEFLEVTQYALSVFMIFEKQMKINRDKVSREIFMNYHEEVPVPSKEKRIKESNSEMSIEIDIVQIAIIVPIKNCNHMKKIDEETTTDGFPRIYINDIKTKIDMDESTTNITFYLSSIKSKNLSFSTGTFTAECSMSSEEFTNQPKVNIRVVPQINFDDYLREVSEHKKLTSKHVKSKTKGTASLSEIKFEPLECTIWGRDIIYAVFSGCPPPQNEIQQEPEKEKEKTRPHPKKCENKDEFEFSFTIDRIEATLGDKISCVLQIEKVIMTVPIDISINSLSFKYFYETERSLIQYAEVFRINQIHFSLQNTKDINFNIYQINISFCKDSFSHTQNTINNVSKLMKKIFTSLTCLPIFSQSKSPHKMKPLPQTSAPLTIKENYMNDNNNKSLKFIEIKNTVNNSSNNNINKNKGKKTSNFSFSLGKLIISLHTGYDLKYLIDYTVQMKGSEQSDGEFEVIEPSQFQCKTQRNELENINLSIVSLAFHMSFETETCYDLLFQVNDITIVDNLPSSDIKRIFSRFDISPSMSLCPLILLTLEMSNSFTDISITKYTDYNISCYLKFLPVKLMLHQKSLYFLINFFTPLVPKDDPRCYIDAIDLNDYIAISKASSIEGSTCLSAGNEDKSFVYITKFVVDEFDISVTYHNTEITFSFGDLSFPVPAVDQYKLIVKSIKFGGFATMESFAEVVVGQIVSQISKYQIALDFFRSLALTKPITNMIEHFFDIFMSPYRSYKTGSGVFNGLVHGVKSFLFSLLSENFFIGEKVIKVILATIGVAKSSKIDETSFYAHYFITKENKEYNNYFYK